LSLGIEEAGFYPILVNELNPDAMETYLVNRDAINPLLRQKYHVFDVKELVLDEGLRSNIIKSMNEDYKIDIAAGDLDLLVGGPPCQGFSGIGHRRSYSVEKKQLPSNQLFQDMAYLIGQFRPKIFLFENVKGLLSAKWTNQGVKGEIWDEIFETFCSIPGYEVHWELVHAKDYGVPQNRPRVLMVGIRDDIKKTNYIGNSALAAGLLPMPTGNYPSIEDLLGDLIDPDYFSKGSTTQYLSEPMTDIQKILRYDIRTKKMLRKGDALLEQDYSKHTTNVVQKFSYMLEHNGQIPDNMKTKKFAQRVLPKEWGISGPTITATSLADDYVHYLQPRVLTVREWARLQTFPDWYVFKGKRTTGGIRRAGNPREGLHFREVPKYTQIGNAVPVLLALAVGKHFMDILEGCDA
jgi:DNA (cytosine-5)-methyltransferase 1